MVSFIRAKVCGSSAVRSIFCPSATIRSSGLPYPQKVQRIDCPSIFSVKYWQPGATLITSMSPSASAPVRAMVIPSLVFRSSQRGRRTNSIARTGLPSRQSWYPPRSPASICQGD